MVTDRFAVNSRAESTRVLLAPIFYSPMRCGPAVFTENLAQRLVQRGCRVVVVTPHLEKHHPPFEKMDGIDVYRLRFPFPWRLVWERPDEGWLKFLRWAPWDMWRLRCILLRERINLVSVQSLTGVHVPYLLWARSFRKFAFVVTFHGMEFFQLHARQGRIRRALLRQTLSRADRVVAISSEFAESARRFLPEVSAKIVRIPSAIACDDFQTVKPFAFHSRYILAVARLQPMKGHDVLLLALQKIIRTGRDVHLLIAGDGPLRVRLHALVLALGLKDHVTFLGEVSQNTVRSLLGGCDFFVHPSWFEGLPIAVLEAMASSKAVVATAVNGVPELVENGKTGLLVPPGAPEALAQAITSLLKNRELCSAMGRNAYESVREKYDYAAVTERYLEVFRTAVGGAREDAP